MITIHEIRNIIRELDLQKKSDIPFDSSQYNYLLYNNPFMSYDDIINHLNQYIEDHDGGFGDDFE